MSHDLTNWQWLFDLCQEGDAPQYKEGLGWARWPWSAEEELVLEWLQDLMKRFTAWIDERDVHAAAHRRIYQGPGIYLDGSPVKRKMDVGITARDWRVEEQSRRRWAGLWAPGPRGVQE